jgi:ABC-type sulfate/molybdate transport systems ATPase subunit
VPSAPFRQQAKDPMEELQPNKLPKKQARLLFGGQRKLIALAVAFVGNQPVQVFDEPPNELDAATAIGMRSS